MTSNNAANFGFGAAGQLVKSNGAGAAVGFTTATYPTTAGTSGNVITSDGTNFVSSAPASISLGYKSTYYYFANLTANVNSSANKGLTAGRTYTVPFYIYENVTWDRVAISVQSASAAGTSVRVGVYNNSGSFPTTVLYTLGTTLTDGIGVKTITISQAFTPGFYHIAIQTEGVPTLVSVATSVNKSPLISVGTSFATTGIAGYTYNSTAYASGLANLTSVTPDTFEGFQPITQFRAT